MLIASPFYDGLSGIITLFNNTYGNKYLDYVKVYPSSTNPYYGRKSAEDLIKRDYPSSSKHWCSQAESNPNVIIHFPFHQIKLQAYTLKSRSDSLQPYPREWILEGSNSNTTNSEWHTIDEIGPVDDINGDGLQKTYNVTTNDYYSYFRFTQVTESRSHFCFSKVEFFGSIIGRVGFTCKLINSTHYLIHLFLLVLMI